MNQMTYKEFLALRTARLKRLTDQHEEMEREKEKREREARINQIMGR